MYVCVEISHSCPQYGTTHRRVKFAVDHKVKGPAASAACELPPTPAEAARLDGMTLEQLLAEWRAASEVHSRGSSSYRGVDWNKDRQAWRMKIRNPHTGKQETKGGFDVEEAAAREYDARARILYGK